MPDLRNRFLNQPDLANLIGYLLSRAGRYCMLFDKQMYGMPLNNCIMAGRIAMEVMKHYGVRNARCEAVEVYVTNNRWREIMEVHDRMPETNEEMDEWMEDGGYAIGASGSSLKPEAPGTWNGHLICLAENVLVDLSLDQFNRPDKGIDLTTFYGNVSTTFLDGRERASFQRDDGGLVVYGLQPWNASWKTSGDWALYPTYKHVTEKIVEEINSMEEPTPVRRSA